MNAWDKGAGPEGRQRPSGFLLGVLTALVATGCHSYAAVRPADVSPGEYVRVTVAEAREDLLAAAVLRESSGRVLEGTVTGLDGGSLLMSVPVTVQDQGSTVNVLGQRVRIAQGDIVALEVRSLSHARSGMLAAVGVGIAAAAWIAINSGVLGGNTQRPIPPGDGQLHPRRCCY